MIVIHYNKINCCAVDKALFLPNALIFLLISLFSTISCQSTYYGSPQHTFSLSDKKTSYPFTQFIYSFDSMPDALTVA